MRRTKPLTILDIGTGSGAILAALLHEMPSATGVGVDRSAAACRIARANVLAMNAGRRAAIACCNWSDGVQARFDVVVSNPPYVAAGDIAGLDREVRLHDPDLALDGGPDGLDAYRAIVPRLPRLLQPDGIVAFECGAGQGAQVTAMLEDVDIEAAVYLDLAGHDRVVIGSMTPRP